MNVNPTATTILTYGDSNTHGQKPDRSGRFDAATRWTGILQSQLGGDFYVIEEGLGGRTTNLDHPNPNKPGRNGFDYFQTCLESHSPLDIILIMLGTNDFKTAYHRSAVEIAEALQVYIDAIKKSYESSKARQPRIILVSPPYMDDTAPLFYESMPTPGIYDETSITKSHELAAHIEQLAERNQVAFFDAAPITQTGDDGVHITASSHEALGKALATTIQKLSI